MQGKSVFVTQARGIEAESPFIESHKAFAEHRGLEHRIVSEIQFPEWALKQYANPYKYGKSFILLDNMQEYDFVVFAESDVMITEPTAPVPFPRGGHWLRAGSCRPAADGPCICPCLMVVRTCAQAEEFFRKSIDLMQGGFVDGFPFDESLFHETRRALGMASWDLDSSLCGYHTAPYRDAITRPWFPGDFALHISGVDWAHKYDVFRATVAGPHRPPGLSLVVACMNRNERLAATLPSWLNHPLVSEVVAVDWSSSVPLSDTLSSLLAVSDKLRVLRVEGEREFNLGQAYNAALRYATFDTILKIDADYMLADPRFVEEIAAQRKSGALMKSFVTGHFASATPALNGLILCHAAYLQSTGYREDFSGWGYDDDDLYDRLRKAVRSRELFTELDKKVIHVPHDDRARTENYTSKVIERSWEVNFQKSKQEPELPPRRYISYGTRQMAKLSPVPPAASRTLLRATDYTQIFEPWWGRRVAFGYAEHLGNTGDKLIWDAARQLFAYYGMTVVPMQEAEVAMFTGGGSMGTLYPAVVKLRFDFFSAARQQGIPTVLLPQSWNAPDATADLVDHVFARDTHSLQFCERALLSPDLALAWSGAIHVPEVVSRKGIFLRNDTEKNLGSPAYTDPAKVRSSLEGYLSLASGCQHLVTDRLHFAIAGLLAGRDVTLLPNSYGKNRGVFEANLEALGCKWSDSIPAEAPKQESCSCDCCAP